MSPTPPQDTGYEPRSRSTPRALLKRLREIMAEETAPQVRLDHLVSSIAANMVADVCSIYVRRADDVLELFATQGLNPAAVHATRLDMSEGVVGWVARHRRPLKLDNAKTHEAFSYRAETGEDPLHAFLGVPIIRSGQVIGVLVIQNIAKRDFSEEETEVAQTVATVLAEIVSTGQLLEERDRQDVEAVLHKPEHMVGAPIVPGIAEGHVLRREPRVPAHRTFASNVGSEKQRLEDAIAAMQKSIDDMIAADTGLQGASKEVLEVYRLFAYDKGWVRRLEEKVLSGLSAESAVVQVQEENRQRMRSVKDPYLRERFHDLDDLARRLLRELAGEQTGPENIPENAILVAETLGPAELLDLDLERLKGIVLSEGASTSHAAIVARSLSIPMVAGLPDIVDRADNGDLVVLDGATGDVHLRPHEAVVDAFHDKKILRTRTLKEYSAYKDQPAVTRDGREIELQMNAGLILDMAHLKETGARSVGLFRTEFQFLMGNRLPTTADQEALYRRVLEAAEGREVTFRTADIGSDKRAGYMEGPREVNPAMGWRGLRVAIDREGFMRTQIRALLRAAQGRHLSFMLPLVTTVEEVVAARALVDKEMARLERQSATPPSSLSMGAMIEIPSAAWDCSRIAAACDFISIGGNDLAPFFFAADRENTLVSRRYDPLSPIFLGFLARTANEGKSAGRPVGYCGEQAADPLMALALIAIGIDRLSVPASAIGPIKAMIRSSSYEPLRSFVAEMISKGTPDMREEMRKFVRDQQITAIK